jgi:two-component system, OmpR family, sensor histidine kinase KdpD
MVKAKVGSPASVLRCLLIMALLIVAATGVGLLFRSIGFHEANIVIVYILSVLLTARFTQGYVYGILASLAATLTFNFVFTEPFFTLSVNDPSYFVTFAVMTVTAIVTCALTSKEKQSALEAMEKEAETSALYHLTNKLTDAADMNAITGVAASAISDVFGCKALVLCFGENKKPGRRCDQQGDGNTLIWSKADDVPFMNMENPSAPHNTGGWFCEWPIHGREAILGVVRIPREINLSESQTRILRSMIESTALAMDRFHSAQARIRSTEEAAQERYRGNLLRAISHDLRTPLSGIMGTAEMLKGMTEPDDPRHALAEDIFRESDWLHSLVQNILSLTRLRDGALPLNKQMEPVEEVIGGAVNRVMRQSGREIAVEAPDEVLFIPMDAGLIEQVLVNLLDNAVKYTLPMGEIRVSVRRDNENQQAVFSVMDHGAGIREDDLPHIFQMFYTTPSRQADASRGVGLGLTICEAIVKAHGGTITARNRADGPGAAFEFMLPMEEQRDAKAK